jgi:hypothetical protein
MEFRLLYEGVIESGGNRAKVAVKHDIRRIFHPQLRRLWNVSPNLQQFAEFNGSQTADSWDADTVRKDGMFKLGLEAIGRKWGCAGFNFVPLVTAEMNPRCSLDILLLRPEDNRFVLNQGDLDGQVKTLVDALKMPKQEQDIGVGPQDDENPFFCLLEDDRLISEVRVVADQLLLLPHERKPKPTDAFAVVHVKVDHKRRGTFDQWLA